MKTRSCLMGLLCLIVFAFLIILPVNAYGVGLGPSDLQVNNTLRGTSVERSLTVYNLGDTDSRFELKADGAAGNWIQFYDSGTENAPVTSVTVTARETKPLIIRITIPSDTANGLYNATIHATLQPSGATKVQLGVNAILEATSQLSVGVTGEQKTAGTVEYIVVDNTEANSPLPIRVLFRNTGNVAANPQIVTVISGKSGPIDTITESGTQVSAGKTDTILVKWTKTGIEPGNYTADVKVNLGGAQIASKTAQFTIAPAGTLSRQGNFTTLVYEGNPVPGVPLKIIGTFENAGTIATKAKLVGEVYRDGTLVDTFTSDELSIPVNGRDDLTYYLKVQTPGTYTVKAYVLYEGKKTDIKEISIKVTGTSAAGTSGAATNAAGTNTAGTRPPQTYPPLPPGLAIIAVIASILLAVFYKRRSQ
ncbi:MAG: hypothetical protein WCB46_03065 [Methanoregula sp.]